MHENHWINSVALAFILYGYLARVYVTFRFQISLFYRAQTVAFSIEYTTRIRAIFNCFAQPTTPSSSNPVKP